MVPSTSGSTTRSSPAYWCRSPPARPVRRAPPEAPCLHLVVPRGPVVLEDADTHATGDKVRFTATGGQKVTSTEPAETLVWEMHAALTA